MSASRIFFVGTPELVEHQARPLQAELPIETIAPAELSNVLREGDVCLFINEHFPEYREAIAYAQKLNCPTLYISDGITEWRSCWESEYPPEIWKPILCHKAACIGRSQARVLQSWGNWEKCEVVGSARLDSMLGRAPRRRENGEPFRFLVMTAKRPGFRDDQRQRAVRSLRDLKSWFDATPEIGGVKIQPIWRLTKELDRFVGVENALGDLTGSDIASALQQVDAVITTPSTTMLEGMLQGVPVALLDYNNCPHYVPAAWRITAQEHFAQVLPELLNPPEAKLLYQREILHDALECRTPATPRLITLITKMAEIATQCRAENRAMEFPARILADNPPREHAAELQAGENELRVIVREQQFALGRQARQLDLQDEEQRQLEKELQSYKERYERLRAQPAVRLASRLKRVLLRGA